LLSFPNCKINIGLNIISKRDDGYHNIETVFYPVKLCDILEINKRSDLKENKFDYTNNIALKLSGNEVEGDDKSNLCYKAFQLLKAEFNLPDIILHLHKIIPSGAGLGGGSADAAFTLKLLNDQFKLNLTDDQLKTYAAQLGSDCSFFISNKPSFASGRGEMIEELDLNLSGYHIILIKPEVNVPTSQAYQAVKPAQPKVSLRTLILQPLSSWKENITNDFEEGIFKLYPQLSQIKKELYDSGCIYASMSGSGSCLYGISDKVINIENKFKNCLSWQSIL
jgi:4-diphosphocytidyl-2-C-methyl-D-erythritol kinase